MLLEKSDHKRLDATQLHPKAKELQKFITERLVGQELAARRVCEAYSAWLSPLRQHDKPIGVFLNAGPTGVGKTLIPEVVAEFFFGNRKAFTKIPCGNMKDTYQVTSSLLGAPPGYVGYWDPNDQRYGGIAPPFAQTTIDRYAREQLVAQLLKSDPDIVDLSKRITQVKAHVASENETKQKVLKPLQQDLQELIARKVRARQGEFISVILLDEYEKAHDHINDVLLEVIDKASTRLTNNLTTSFANSFVFMTSNLGASKIAESIRGGHAIGFTSSKDTKGSVYDVTMAEIKKFFRSRPEFVGRLGDGVIVFRPLTEAELVEIMEREFTRLHTELAQKFPVGLLVAPSVRRFIFKSACDHPEYGARLLVTKIDHYIRKPMSRLIGSGQVEVGDWIVAKRERNAVVFRKENPRWLSSHLES